jgi:hypothetical protein
MGLDDDVLALDDNPAPRYPSGSVGTVAVSASASTVGSVGPAWRRKRCNPEQKRDDAGQVSDPKTGSIDA